MNFSKRFIAEVGLLYFFGVFFLTGCTEEQRMKVEWKIKRLTGRETWLATIYPNRSNLTVNRDLGLFESLQECRMAALRELSLAKTPYPEIGDYECGLNCKTLSKLPGIWICDETLH